MFALTFLGASVDLLDVAGTQPWHRQKDSHSFLLLFLHSGTVTQQIECVSPSLLPVSRGSVALLGLGLSGGRCCMLRSCVVVLFLLALDRLSRVFRPVSGSLWMNFFSTYLERIHDSLSPLRHTTHSLSLVKNTPIHFCEMGLLVLSHFFVSSKLHIEFSKLSSRTQMSHFLHRNTML